MIIGMVIAIIIFLLILFAYIFIRKKDFNNKTRSSFEIGESYEEKIYKIIANISSDINVEHFPKGGNTPDLLIKYKSENGKIYNQYVEIKNVKTYSLEWERKLNNYLVENKNENQAIIVSTINKNQRIPECNYWTSKINPKIIILKEDNLRSFILDEFDKFNSDSLMRSKMTISEQKSLDLKNEIIRNDNNFKSFFIVIKKNIDSFKTKFKNINENIEKAWKVKLSNESIYKEVDLNKIKDLTSEIQKLTDELLDEIDIE